MTAAMQQGHLFDTPPSFADSRLDPAERPRLNRQCLAILRLLSSPARSSVSNAELSGIALRYSARIHDLKRVAGISIVIVERDHESGVNWYSFAGPLDRERAAGYMVAE